MKLGAFLHADVEGEYRGLGASGDACVDDGDFLFSRSVASAV